ncbi:MAG TPA: histidine triad nucleotide-binding protein [Levilinea sp.]|nr:histidine triad nucleotide-binding protein [Levilinea sp.]
MTQLNCPFCAIIAGKAEAKIVYQDDLITAFWDHRPIAPVHILLAPNEHIESLNDIRSQHEVMLARLATAGSKVAKEHGLEQSGYRLVINTGRDGGQSVSHLHMHLMGGRRLPFHFQ